MAFSLVSIFITLVIWVFVVAVKNYKTNYKHSYEHSGNKVVSITVTFLKTVDAKTTRSKFIGPSYLSLPREAL